MTDIKLSALIHFNVKDPAYGALGNNSHDDSLAIQAAVNAAAAVGGGRIYFPAGIYLIGSTIDFGVSANFYFEGAVRGNQDSLQGSVITGNIPGYLFDRPTRGSNGVVRIANLTFKNTHASGSGVRLNDCPGGRVEWCQFAAPVFGLNLGGAGQPPTGFFTATLGSGNTIHVTVTSGQIFLGNGPTFIFGDPNIPGNTNINSQVPGIGTPGGSGDYITSNHLLGPISSGQSAPGAPTAFSTTVYNCNFDGQGGVYNPDPNLSFGGIGCQLSPETLIMGCNVVNWATGIRGYGAGNYIYGCRMESNTTGVELGVDGVGSTGPHPPQNVGGTLNLSSAVIISGSTFEGNYCHIHLWNAVAGSIDGCSMQGEGGAIGSDPSHNSNDGILINGAIGLTIRNSTVFGTTSPPYRRNAIFIGGQQQCHRISIENCNISGGLAVGPGAQFDFSQLTVTQSPGIGTPASTIAQLNTAIGAGEVNAGERKFVSNGLAYASSVYGDIVSTTGSTTRSVFWDGTNLRYG